MLHRIFASLIRSSAFLSKEIYDVLRQPRLILTLALGPFLILLLFGIGFRNEARPFRTLFVAPAGEALSQQIEEFGTTLGPQLIYEGITDNQELALSRLRRGEIDLVIVVPADAERTIRNSEQAVFTLYHNEINPLQESYVDYFGQLYVGEVNRRILQQMMASGQMEAASLREDMSAARGSAAALRQALAAGDAEGARSAQSELDVQLSALELGVGASLGLLRGVEQTLGDDAAEDTESVQVAALMAELRQSVDELADIPDGQNNYAAQSEQAADAEAQLSDLDEKLQEFTAISPHVLVSPFVSETFTAAGIRLDITHFFAPGVLALLLQHLAITFGALSIVRERQTNTVELFRAAPVKAREILLGKYLSYMLFGAVLAAILTALLLLLMGVPMLGDWRYYALTLGLLLFASLGIGFVISLLSDSDSQAVQLAMLVLLASVFFSGFFMALHLLWPPIRTVSWMLPVTYGIQLLQSIMLRGLAPNPILLAGLAGIGLLMLVVAWALLRRMMNSRQMR